MLRVFHGLDEREAIGTWVWEHSVLKRACAPVQFTSLDRRSLQGAYEALYALGGSNAFIFSRFAVAALADYAGPPVIFADGADMIALEDLHELAKSWQFGKALQVVKRPDYIPTSPKYRGTEMEADNAYYSRKQWSSVMLISPSHAAWKRVNWESTDPLYWQQLGWLKENELGELDPKWNVLADEGDSLDGAKLLHWTLGVPLMWNYRNSPGADLWWAEAREAMNLCEDKWQSILLKTASEWNRTE